MNTPDDEYREKIRDDEAHAAMIARHQAEDERSAQVEFPPSAMDEAMEQAWADHETCAGLSPKIDFFYGYQAGFFAALKNKTS